MVRGLFRLPPCASLQINSHSRCGTNADQDAQGGGRRLRAGVSESMQPADRNIDRVADADVTLYWNDRMPLLALLIDVVWSGARGSAAADPADHWRGMTDRPIGRSTTRLGCVSPRRRKAPRVPYGAQVVSGHRLATRFVTSSKPKLAPVERRDQSRFAGRTFGWFMRWR